MASKLWEKSVKVNHDVETYTIGLDREMDLYLAPYDVIGSLAHTTMLETIGLIAPDELKIIRKELISIYHDIQNGKFTIDEGIEDVHSQIEFLLTERIGDIGKKIHSGRSRNDQVLVDLRLFMRSEIESIVNYVESLFNTLISQSERYKDVIIPGYTHLQVAMPSSFGLWFGAYAEALIDDLMVLLAAYNVNNRNPLGSAAGYGSSFPLNRTMTTQLLGFASVDFNVVHAQMGRGKTERIVANALAGIAATISKLSFDACMFNSQNFAFIKLPDEFTTGSSIMPHKKNPDVFELSRAKCNKLQSIPYQISMITNNLPSGYFRDLQIIKELFLPMFDELKSIISMVEKMVLSIKVNTEVALDERYKYMYSVEEVNRLASNGMPFRDAYKKVGLDIEAGLFTPDPAIHHSHEGSIGNLCNDRITALFNDTVAQFDFDTYHKAFDDLLSC